MWKHGRDNFLLSKDSKLFKGFLMYQVIFREDFMSSWKVKEGTYTQAEASKVQLALLDLGFKATVKFISDRRMTRNWRVA